ncbi:DMT family transporter [Roseivivax sp. CAU 1753]
MSERRSMDMAGAAGLTVFATLLAFNQVVIAVTNGGLQPVFGAGLRSVAALAVLVIIARGRLPGLWAGGASSFWLGGFFTLEFVLLYNALDLTTVSRASILFYSMPVWLALAAHVALPGERLSRRRALGLVLAMAGVSWALFDPGSRAAGNLLGDLLSLAAAFAWAGIALTVRLGRVSQVPPKTQLFWQLAVSAVVLLAMAPLFGPLLRDPAPIHWAGLAFQSIFVASLGFLFWLTLMTRYRASDIAAFSFLSPVLSVAMGWALLDEPLGPGLIGALVLVAVGITLVNVRQRA